MRLLPHDHCYLIKWSFALPHARMLGLRESRGSSYFFFEFDSHNTHKHHCFDRSSDFLDRVSFCWPLARETASLIDDLSAAILGPATGSPLITINYRCIISKHQLYVSVCSSLPVCAYNSIELVYL